MNRIEQLILPDPTHYFGEGWKDGRYGRKSFWQKVWYWICNFPGIRFFCAGFRVTMLDAFERHPWDRIYLNNKYWHITIAPFTKVQGFDPATEKYTDEWGWISISPQRSGLWEKMNK